MKEIDDIVDLELPKEIMEKVLEKLKHLTDVLKGKKIDAELVDIIVQQLLEHLSTKWMYETYCLVNRREEFAWIFVSEEE